MNETTAAFVVLSTNGALLTPANRAQLIAARPRQIHVNISSADREQYEALMKGLDYEQTFENTRKFIEETDGRIAIKINCPVVDGVDTAILASAFPRVPVNTGYWANSRGGLLDGVSASGKGTRFKLDDYCTQPTVNFNVLWDGSVIACCMDWAHESKSDFPSILDHNLFDTYNNVAMRQTQREFQVGDYSRYRMCSSCAPELGFPVSKLRPTETAELVQLTTA